MSWGGFVAANRFQCKCHFRRPTFPRKKTYYSFFFRVSVAVDFQASTVISLKQPSLRVRPHQAETDTGVVAARRMAVNLTAHLSVYLSERKLSFSTVNQDRADTSEPEGDMTPPELIISARYACCKWEHGQRQPELLAVSSPEAVLLSKKGVQCACLLACN